MADNSDNAHTFNGISLSVFNEAFAPHVKEFAASRFVFTKERMDQVRIAFGNQGPITDNQGSRGCPRFSHAVTLSSDDAVELAQLLIKHYAGIPESKT